MSAVFKYPRFLRLRTQERRESDKSTPLGVRSVCDRKSQSKFLASTIYRQRFFIIPHDLLIHLNPRLRLYAQRRDLLAILADGSLRIYHCVDIRKGKKSSMRQTKFFLPERNKEPLSKAKTAKNHLTRYLYYTSL